VTAIIASKMNVKMAIKNPRMVYPVWVKIDDF
jgi:hypothetical protein